MMNQGGPVRRLLHRGVMIGVLFILVGCVGQGETVKLYPRVGEVAKPAVALPQDRLIVRIVPFEDRRAKKGVTAKRIHAAGGATYYRIWDDKPGDGLARFLADYLTAKGWDAKVQPAADAADRERVDVVVTGQVLEFGANTTSLLGSSKIDVSLLVALQTHGDGRQGERMTLQASRTEKMMLFDDRDLELAIAGAMTDGLDRLMAETTVVNRMWRPKMD